MSDIVTRRVEFATPYHKARWMAGQARLDALLEPIRNKAQEFLVKSAFARINKIFCFVRDEIRYVRDPGGREQLADAAVVLRRGMDDCDGKFRLFAALVHATEHLDPVGLEVEAVPVFPFPDEFSHITAQVRWPRSKLMGKADKDGWVRAETILAGLPLGSGSEDAARDALGKIIFS